MLEDAQNQIKMLLDTGVIKSITFYNTGKISVQFHDEPRKIIFTELLSILEIAEAKKKP